MEVVFPLLASPTAEAMTPPAVLSIRLLGADSFAVNYRVPYPQLITVLVAPGSFTLFPLEHSHTMYHSNRMWVVPPQATSQPFGTRVTLPQEGGACCPGGPVVLTALTQRAPGGTEPSGGRLVSEPTFHPTSQSQRQR